MEPRLAWNPECRLKVCAHPQHSLSEGHWTARHVFPCFSFPLSEAILIPDVSDLILNASLSPTELGATLPQGIQDTEHSATAFAVVWCVNPAHTAAGHPCPTQLRTPTPGTARVLGFEL